MPANQKYLRKDRLDLFMNPRSVAIVGASRKHGPGSFNLIENMRAFGYTGKIFPVNPAGEEVLGFRGYRRVKEIPEPVDLAVFIVPAEKTLEPLSLPVGVGKALGDHDDSRYSGVGAVFDNARDMLPGGVEDGDIDGLRDVPDISVNLQTQDLIGLRVDGNDLQPCHDLRLSNSFRLSLSSNRASDCDFHVRNRVGELLDREAVCPDKK